MVDDYASSQTSILTRPQLWVVPGAVAFLGTVHWEHHRIPPKQLSNLRYLSIGILYISSTMELFVQGMDLWEPVVLTVLSIAGMLIGIGLQLRAFLYNGLTFLAVVVITIVWKVC